MSTGDRVRDRARARLDGPERRRSASVLRPPSRAAWHRKQPIAQLFMAGSSLRFVETPEPLAADETRAVWGLPDWRRRRRRRRGWPSAARRLVGLGANRIRPLSWVIDGRGSCTYDADGAVRPRTTARDRVLRRGDAGACAGAARCDRQRAHHEVQRRGRCLAAANRRATSDPRARAGRSQSDASIALGAPGVRTNLGLLRAARERTACTPSSSRTRRAGWRARRRAPRRRKSASGDEVVTDVPIHALFDEVDALEVRLLVAGFEALLRGSRWFATAARSMPGRGGHGGPPVAHPRRQRRLRLDELVAGALISYPTYVSH